ncbi:hypothetical protein NDU88_001917 [Pleurodeles waltl]|uniref:Uncharacterized protein n=1 Tax=Pleurodeles waltl TaxID=8319 RepID=A0AAV7R8H4_PLEWA|nr:hypothetical protein NDU88_001917 [Pleurodeles waltl]
MPDQATAVQARGKVWVPTMGVKGDGKEVKSPERFAWSHAFTVALVTDINPRSMTAVEERDPPQRSGLQRPIHV